MNIHQYSRLIRISLLSATLLGCATGHPANPRDPFEGLNRKVFYFNQQVDKFVYRPIAKAYDTVVPQPIDRGVTNFFSNLGEITTIANDILQANIGRMISDSARFFVNTTVGALGLFDTASHIGLPHHEQDFGLTLAKWGVKESPYFMIPFLGPSTLRDTIGLPINYYTSIFPYVDSTNLRYGLVALEKIDMRAGLLHTDKLINQAFDPYIFMRNAYLQRRTHLTKQNQPKKQEHGTPEKDHYVEE